MTVHEIEIQIIAILVASSCALPGTFLLLRKMAMMTDAISHSILLGIVVAFFLIKDIASPFLIAGAALSGVLTVFFVEILNKKKFVSNDASIGLVFPLLFSIGIILIGLFAWNIHLDIHAVLLGELAFAPFDRIYYLGKDLGPKSIYVMGSILVLNIAFITIFYKELKITTFDQNLSAAFRFFPKIINIALMTLVSITCVGAFDSVGSILVIALMIVPPCCAFMLTKSLSKMLILSVLIGIFSSVCGFWVANLLNANIAGSMAVVSGVIFGVIFLSAPKKGFFAIKIKKMKQKWEFAENLLLVHLSNHEGGSNYEDESSIEHLHKHMLWAPDFASRVIEIARKKGNINIINNGLFLTDKGRSFVADNS